MSTYRNPHRWQDDAPERIPEDETRCAAALRGYWNGQQCSRQRPEGDRYCTQHRKLLDQLFPGAER